MLENLDRLSKASGDMFFDDAGRRMRANLSYFRTWNDIARFTANLSEQLQVATPGDITGPQISTAAMEVESETHQATVALKALENAREGQVYRTSRRCADRNLVCAARGVWRFSRLCY